MVMRKRKKDNNPSVDDITNPYIPTEGLFPSKPKKKAKKKAPLGMGKVRRLDEGRLKKKAKKKVTKSTPPLGMGKVRRLDEGRMDKNPNKAPPKAKTPIKKSDKKTGRTIMSMKAFKALEKRFRSLYATKGMSEVRKQWKMWKKANASNGVVYDKATGKNLRINFSGLKKKDAMPKYKAPESVKRSAKRPIKKPKVDIARPSKDEDYSSLSPKFKKPKTIKWKKR